MVSFVGQESKVKVTGDRIRFRGMAEASLSTPFGGVGFLVSATIGI